MGVGDYVACLQRESRQPAPSGNGSLRASRRKEGLLREKKKET